MTRDQEVRKAFLALLVRAAAENRHHRKIRRKYIS